MNFRECLLCEVRVPSPLLGFEELLGSQNTLGVIAVCPVVTPSSAQRHHVVNMMTIAERMFAICADATLIVDHFTQISAVCPHSSARTPPGTAVLSRGLPSSPCSAQAPTISGRSR